MGRLALCPGGPRLLILLLVLSLTPRVFPQERSFYDLFPNLNEEQIAQVLSETGLMNILEQNEALALIPASGAGIDLYQHIMERKPSYAAEALILIPQGESPFTRVDAYNVLSQVRLLEGRLYPSHSRGEVPLFSEVTRIAGPQERSQALPDPPRLAQVPQEETVYLRVRDINFGNSFFRGQLTLSPYGIIYDLTNFRNLSYLIFTVVRREEFYALLYTEPLAEGMLLYIVAGAEVSGLVAALIDVPSAIGKRGMVFFNWVNEGLRTMANP
ncbi:MAG: hypothetical protein FWH12_08335 [Treponema sp.]|nr:hypothetical protein [Treponema sp.]